MKLTVIFAFALLLAFSNAGRFDTCKHWFEAITKNEIFKAGSNYYNDHRRDVFSILKQIWTDKCKTEINIIAGYGGYAAGDMYRANTDLYNTIIRMDVSYYFREDPGRLFAQSWVEYVNKFRHAVVNAYQNSPNENCRNKIKNELITCSPTPYRIDEAFEIGWRTFDSMDYCESNKHNRLLVLAEKLRRRAD